MQVPITMNMAQKYATSPDNSVCTFQFIKKNFGCSRKVYNLCVDDLYQQLEEAGYQPGDRIPKTTAPKASELKKQYPYLKEADSLGSANSIMDFRDSFSRFCRQPSHKAYTKRTLRRDASGTEKLSFRGLKGIPKFHAKAQGYFSYRTACQYPDGKNGLKQPTIRLEGDRLYLPKLKEGLKLILHRELPADAHINNATVSMDTDGTIHASICYSYTIMVEMSLQDAAMDRGTVPEGVSFLGLDYSQKDFYADSEGRKANCPKYYRESEKRLAMLQKKLSRQEKDGKNYLKTLKKIQTLHTKIKKPEEGFPA